MSTCNCTVGRHNLDTSSLERTARQLSDIFDFNISWGCYDDDGFVEQGRVMKYPGRPVFMLEDCSDETDPVMFELTCSTLNEEESQ